MQMEISQQKYISGILCTLCGFSIDIVQINERSMGRTNVILSGTVPLCVSE